MKTAEISVSMIDTMGTDVSIVNAARVSFAKEQSGVYPDEADKKLIKYLAKHNHWSPFAHTSLQFRIKAPIFVARQLAKHQVGGVWNEVSRRYVDDEPEFYFPKVWREKAENVKQGSGGAHRFSEDYNRAMRRVVEECLNLYTVMYHDDMAPEMSRMVLPQNMMTEWIWTGSLVFFARVCDLRLDPHAQAETAEVARQIDDCIRPIFPHAWAALRGQSE